MEEKKEKTIEELVSEAKSYVDTRLDYLHLKSVEKGSKLFADLITNTVVVVCFLLAFLLGTVTLALYLAEVFGSYVAGFGCVAGLYLLISIIVFLTKDNIIEKILVNMFIRNYFNKIADKDDEA
ncbi:phage holin family protein [Pedobacter sp. UBA4863]|uniref:phage holin family protein n=1 Tax=Pedobacter sp. UBA4863 TaxID=1947060 RepID=UPI0025E9A89F|nr:phage holin family protein [Pedobacter sp. UBA4863]